MNEELTKWLVGVLKDTKDFALDQAPEIAHQIIWLGIATNIALALLGLSLFIVAFWWFKCALHEANKEYHKQEEAFIAFAGVGSMVLFGIAIALELVGIYELLKALLAPKIFLLEYVAGLVK